MHSIYHQSTLLIEQRQYEKCSRRLPAQIIIINSLSNLNCYFVLLLQKQALLLVQASKSYPTKHKAYCSSNTFPNVATNQAFESMLCCLPSQAAAGDAIIMLVSYILIFMLSSDLRLRLWFTQYKTRIALMTIITLRRHFLLVQIPNN
jgi:hypothetical protein